MSFELLDKFIDMYKSRMLMSIKHYKDTGEKCILLARVENTIVPDLDVEIHTQENFSFDLNNPTVSIMLEQFRSYDPRTECIMGVQTKTGDVFTHVLRVSKMR